MDTSHTVPQDGDDLTSSWLRSVLAPHFPDARLDLTNIERIGQGYGLSAVILRCRLAGGQGPRSVVVKLWRTDGLAGAQEVRFYVSFATRLGIRVPACYHGAIDERHRRGVLVLEDIEGAIQGDCLSRLDAAGAAGMADTIAAFHATWWKCADLESGWLPPLVHHGREWLRSRREEFLGRFGDRVGPTILGLLEKIDRVAARARECTNGAATTLLHADLHLDNVLFVGPFRDPVLLDWARVAKGPGVVDLADVLVEMTPIGAIEATMETYAGGLIRHGVAGVDRERLRRELRGALLRKMIRSTCGAARWQAGSEREERMISTGLDRITEAIEYWGTLDSEFMASLED